MIHSVYNLPPLSFPPPPPPLLLSLSSSSPPPPGVPSPPSLIPARLMEPLHDMSQVSLCYRPVAPNDPGKTSNVPPQYASVRDIRRNLLKKRPARITPGRYAKSNNYLNYPGFSSALGPWYSGPNSLKKTLDEGMAVHGFSCYDDFDYNCALEYAQEYLQVFIDFMASEALNPDRTGDECLDVECRFDVLDGEDPVVSGIPKNAAKKFLKGINCGNLHLHTTNLLSFALTDESQERFIGGH